MSNQDSRSSGPIKVLKLLGDDVRCLILKKLIAGEATAGEIRRGLADVHRSKSAKRLRELIVGGLVEPIGEKEPRRYRIRGRNGPARLKKFLKDLGRIGKRYLRAAWKCPRMASVKSGKPPAVLRISIDVLLLLANDVRFLILHELSQHASSVNGLCGYLGDAYPGTASQHLRELHAGGLVRMRSKGNQRVYRVHGMVGAARLKKFFDELETIGKKCFGRLWTSVDERRAATGKRLKKYDAFKDKKRQQTHRRKLHSVTEVAKGLL